MLLRNTPRWIPVVSAIGTPLMPCHPARARKLITKGKAIKRYRGGFFYIQLAQRGCGEAQQVVIGIDPGSMREAYTVMSSKRTYVNIQTHAADGKGIKRAVETRSNARGARRNRNTPCRQPRWSNRSRKDWLPPSTRARWQRKLNIVVFLNRLYPITHIAIEDVSMPTKKGDKRHNNSFSPIQAGKNWLYKQLESLGYTVSKYRGLETASFRAQLGLEKSKNKLASVFSAHCVDSWVLANAVSGGRVAVDLDTIVELVHHKFIRRQLHRFNPAKGGKRSRYGGTMSLGVKKGTLCSWKDKGYYIVGGTDGNGGLSLHTPITGTRVTQSANLNDVHLISYSPWRFVDHKATTLTKKERVIRRLQKLSQTLHKCGILQPKVDLVLKTGSVV